MLLEDALKPEEHGLVEVAVVIVGAVPELAGSIDVRGAAVARRGRLLPHGPAPDLEQQQQQQHQ